MRLTSVEVIPYALPFRAPYVTAKGTLRRREMVLLRLRTDEGLVGLGEAVPLSLRGGAPLEQVVRELGEVDRGEALHDLVAAGRLDRRGEISLDPRPVLSAPSRCAVLTALHDLRAKLRGERWGAPEVTCNATLVAGSPAAVAADAEAWAAAGFRTFKLKLGSGDDAAQVRAVRTAVGPAAKLRLDANAAWSPEQALRVLDAVEPCGIELVEQPVATMAEAARLARATTIPLAGDESITSRAEAERAVALEAFQATGIKLVKVGGHSAGLAIAEVLPAYVSSALDGPVGIAAGAALAGALDGEAAALGRERLAHGLATQRLFAATIAAVECELRDDRLLTPPGPGLGVEIDEDALEAHRL